MRRRSGFQFASWLLQATFATAHSADVLTQHNNNQRTDVNDAETTLTPAKIKPDAFGTNDPEWGILGRAFSGHP